MNNAIRHHSRHEAIIDIFEDVLDSRLAYRLHARILRHTFFPYVCSDFCLVRRLFVYRFYSILFCFVEVVLAFI